MADALLPSTPPMHQQRQRFQTYLVLSTLERELAQYLLQINASIPAPLRVELEARHARHGGSSSSSPTLEALLNETYIKELIDIAVHATRGTPHGELFLELLQSCERSGIWEIRNACAHPNRPFSPAAWYRVAALAHESCVYKLGFEKLLAAVAAAEEGSFDVERVTIPPLAEWLPKHNIAGSFDHTPTGLIGRNRELASLLKSLANPRHRALALIGPPGVGKTSLLLEAAHAAAHDTRTVAWADAIVYCTIKHTELSAAGERVVSPDVVDSVAKLMERIGGALRDAGLWIPEDTEDASSRLWRHQLNGMRVMLCVDNFETILLRDPTALSRLIDELPVRWRVMASSQVPPDGAFGVEVRNLDPEAAKRLAREYAKSKGVVSLGEDHVAQLAAVWDGNPLAIRLAVDAFNAVASIPEATFASKQAFIQYAYGAMLRLLSSDCRQCLECLLATDEWSSAARCAFLLQIPLDATRAALVTLSRTSLVRRRKAGPEESYRLADPIRDLLLVTPADAECRTRLPARLRSLARQETGSPAHVDLDDPTAWNYLPPEASDLRVLASETFRLKQADLDAESGGAREEAHRLLGLLEETARPSGAASSVVARCRVHLLRMLGDALGADRALLESLASPERDVPLTIAAACTLLGRGKAADAATLLEPLWTSPPPAPAALRTKSRRRVLEPYLRALRETKSVQKILEISADWRKSQTGLRGVLAAAWLQAHVDEVNETGAPTEKFRRMMCTHFYPAADELFRSDGYTDGPVTVLSRIFGTCTLALKGCQRRGDYVQLTLEFFARHARFIASTGRVGDLESGKLRRLIDALLETGGPNNPLRTPAWTATLSGRDARAGFERRGYIRTRVLRPWIGSGRSQLFTEDADRNVYFVLGEQALDAKGAPVSRRRFGEIVSGDEILVLPDWSNGWTKDPDKGQPTLGSVVLAAVVKPSSKQRGSSR